jgi:hypothetical protein
MTWIPSDALDSTGVTSKDIDSSGSRWTRNACGLVARTSREKAVGGVPFYIEDAVGVWVKDRPWRF